MKGKKRVLVLCIFLAVSLVWSFYSFYSPKEETITGRVVGDDEVDVEDVGNNVDIVDNINSDEDSNRELHYIHTDLTYAFLDESSCGKVQALRVRWAFEELQNQTNNLLTFEEITNIEETDAEADRADIADINIICRREVPLADISGYVVAGEATYEHIGNEITRGFIYFYNTGASGSYGGGCVRYPDTEIHEILHSFGFEHSNNSESIMFPYSSCKYKIDKETLDKLEEIYG